MLRRNSLERRLFGWLLVLSIVPPMIVLAGTVTAGAGWFELTGTLGPWDRVAESGRAVIDAARPAAEADSALASTLARHERELSESLVLARRWAFVGERLSTVLSIVALVAALLFAAAALLVARRLARELARPIHDLVDWSERLGRGEPLPEPTANETAEVGEVQALRGALRQASAEIRAARVREIESARLRAWGEMARRLAHEMKNPLTPLRLAAHRLLRAEADSAVAEAAEVIGEETARLEEMAKQFAALGRPPEGPPSEVDLAELLRGLLDTDVPQVVERSLVVEPGTATILAHYDALVRAFRNLIRNAVEAMAGTDGGRITVALRPSEPAGVEVTLSDSGPGFPDGMAERIFEPDFTLKAGGTGLGLAVVRQIIASHGGEVHARSAKPGGAEFIVRLPPAPVRSAAA